MIIVSGSIRTDPAARDDYVAGCREVIEQARRAPGCVDFHITSEQQAAIRDAEVYQHVVESSERL